MCIDDFALKRRLRYGTIMVDIETGRTIDIFESRESGDIAQWLSTYPNIEVVSRDGSTEYAKAISTAHPDAVQVSDRFHLIKNLTESAAQHIRKICAARVSIEKRGETQSDADGGYWDKPERFGPDLPERQHNASTEKRRIAVTRVRELAAQDFSLSQIVKVTGYSYRTVKVYMDETFDPAYINYGVSYPSILDPYADTIDTMLRQRKKFREIEEAIRQFGYNGAASTIRMYATRQRRRIKAAAAEALKNTELVERKWLTKLLYLPIEKVKGITEEQLERVIEEYPIIGILYDTVRAFKEIVFSKKADELDSWIEAAFSLEIEEINSFIGGITRDLDAVKNAIIYQYNNGLAEGSINKLKVIKRIMYGRNSFDLLRNKLLHRELLRFVNYLWKEPNTP